MDWWECRTVLYEMVQSALKEDENPWGGGGYFVPEFVMCNVKLLNF